MLPDRREDRMNQQQHEDRDAYVAFQEGTRLLADDNAHAAVIALERAPRARARTGLGARRRSPAPTSAPAGSTQAEAEFQAAVDIDPVNDYAHYGLGVCRLRAGDRHGARGHLAARDRDAPRQRRLPARARRGVRRRGSDESERWHAVDDRLLRSRRRDLARATTRSRARPAASPQLRARGLAGRVPHEQLERHASRTTSRSCSGVGVDADPDDVGSSAQAAAALLAPRSPAPARAVLACAGPGVVEALEARGLRRRRSRRRPTRSSSAGTASSTSSG